MDRFEKIEDLRSCLVGRIVEFDGGGSWLKGEGEGFYTRFSRRLCAALMLGDDTNYFENLLNSARCSFQEKIQE
jgi:hypothetical protein